MFIPAITTRLRRTGALLAGIGLVGAVITTTASPAAAQGTRPCAEYSYCFYQNTDYKGWQLQYKATNYGEFSKPPFSTRTGVQDQTSSIINNTNRKLCIYNKRTLRSPEVLQVRAYQDYRNLVDIGWNDKADYWRLIAANDTCPSK